MRVTGEVRDRVGRRAGVEYRRAGVRRTARDSVRVDRSAIAELRENDKGTLLSYCSNSHKSQWM